MYCKGIPSFGCGGLYAKYGRVYSACLLWAEPLSFKLQFWAHNIKLAAKTAQFLLIII